MKPVIVLLLTGAVLAGCSRPQPAAKHLDIFAPSKAVAPKPAIAETTDPVTHAVKNRLDGANGPGNALETLHDFGIACKSLTGFGFVKPMAAGKAFRAQCDGVNWYVLLESPDGPIKVLHWSGSEAPQ
jgi:hypothetical protein